MISFSQLEVEVVEPVELDLRDVFKPYNLLLGLFALVNDAHAFFLLTAVVNQSLQRLFVH